MSHFTDGGFKSFQAAQDIPAYTAVKLSGKQIVPATSPSDVILGTIHADVKANWTIDVRLRNTDGTANIKLSGTVAANDPVTTDGSGLGVKATTAGNQIIGYALEAGVAGAVIEVLSTMSKF